MAGAWAAWRGWSTGESRRTGKALRLWKSEMGLACDWNGWLLAEIVTGLVVLYSMKRMVLQ